MRKVLPLLLLSLVSWSCRNVNIETVSTTATRNYFKSCSYKIEAPSDTPDCVVSLSEFRQSMDGFGYTLTPGDVRFLSGLSDRNKDKIIDALHSPDEAGTGIIHIAVSTTGYSQYLSGEITADKMPQIIDECGSADSTLFKPFLSKVIEKTGCKILWTMPQRNIENVNFIDSLSESATSMKIYSDYFYSFARKMLDAGIKINMTSPRDDINDNMPPLCNEKSTATFISDYFGPQMYDIATKVCMGNISAPSLNLNLDSLLSEKQVCEYVYSFSFYDTQNPDWIIDISKKHDIRHLFAKQVRDEKLKEFFTVWDRMKNTIRAGATAYVFSNLCDTTENETALLKFDKDKNMTFDKEYYILKQISGHVFEGALLAKTYGSFDDMLAFLNKDNSAVLVMANKSDKSRKIVININDYSIHTTLPPMSLNTMTIHGDNGFR